MPDDIDFSEEGDAPIRDMGNMLSKTMEQRESELNNITQRYDQGDSLKWLNSGGVPKLTIHDDNFEYLDAPVSIVGSIDTPAIPLNSTLEATLLTNSEKVKVELEKLLNY